VGQARLAGRPEEELISHMRNDGRGCHASSLFMSSRISPTSSPRKRGPILPEVSVKEILEQSSRSYHFVRWLWIPALAGTTLGVWPRSRAIHSCHHRPWAGDPDTLSTVPR
jgi:hypothetical protein